MRFLFSVIASRSGEATADRDEMEAIDAFNEKIESAGQRVMAAGVAAPDRATTFDNRGGLGSVSSGPAEDTDLFMAGFWIIDAADDSIAHQLAMEASRACNRLIEVRPFLG